MTGRAGIYEQIVAALRDHGITAAIGVWFTFIAGIATAVTRKAFTNEALMQKLEAELERERRRANEERERAEAQRLEDRKADAEHRERLELDMAEMRRLLFAVTQYPPPPQ